ncbi:hypothetical protein GGR56DRAFT_622086 [Xylariaceae sp. FL0804]|nr:hypothetical protein GGR56DRAFT_622086 [Xylariaceae sp. FL0804]
MAIKQIALLALAGAASAQMQNMGMSSSMTTSTTDMDSTSTAMSPTMTSLMATSVTSAMAASMPVAASSGMASGSQMSTMNTMVSSSGMAGMSSTMAGAGMPMSTGGMVMPNGTTTGAPVMGSGMVNGISVCSPDPVIDDVRTEADGRIRSGSSSCRSDSLLYSSYKGGSMRFGGSGGRAGDRTSGEDVGLGRRENFYPDTAVSHRFPSAHIRGHGV